MAMSDDVNFFVSYTGVDEAWAEWIAWVLEEAGYTTRLQVWDFGPGSRFVDQMHQAAQQAQRTVAVLSDAYLGSRFGAAEWQAAWADDPDGRIGKLLVFRVEDCPQPGLLGQLVSVDLFGVGQEAAAGRLLAAARGERGKPSTRPVFPGGRAVSEGSVDKRAPVFPGQRPPGVELIVVGDAAGDHLRSLRSWLLEEPELRGRVSLREAPPGPGEMGPRPAAVVVSLRASALRSVQALDLALASWGRSRRSGQEIQVELRAGDLRVKVSTSSEGLKNPALRSFFEALEALMVAGSAPDRDGSNGADTVGVSEGLTRVQVEALAEVYGSPPAAGALMHRAGLRPELFAAFVEGTFAVSFWTEVGHQLELGRAPGGAASLLTAAAEDYPGHPVFSGRG
ncbi:TIR domain-containing protein [Parafrankia sp. EAN1pec]|uniref:effector-associated constant component EACC1 n=1 Tax=Parafrankia sp. (strain EAN1pec) TaxID=298653 RepID=UPI0026B1378F